MYASLEITIGYPDGKNLPSWFFTAATVTAKRFSQKQGF